MHTPLIAGEYVHMVSESNAFMLSRSTQQVKSQTEQSGWLSAAYSFLYFTQPGKLIYAYRAQEP